MNKALGSSPNIPTLKLKNRIFLILGFWNLNFWGLKYLVKEDPHPQTEA
jgi:hypothetical protein